MAFSFINLISSSDTLTKREAVILKISPPAIITSAEVIIAEYDAILGQWEGEDFYNHLSNYTNNYYCFSKIQLDGQKNIKTKYLLLVKPRQNMIHLPLFWLWKPALFATSQLQYIA